MYGTPGGEIPGVGKVELSWVQTPLAPVTPTTPAAAAPRGEDTAMGMDEGDAMASGPVGGGAGARQTHEQQESANLDYDVADDNDWGIQ